MQGDVAIDVVCGFAIVHRCVTQQDTTLHSNIFSQFRVSRLAHILDCV